MFAETQQCIKTGTAEKDKSLATMYAKECKKYIPSKTALQEVVVDIKYG